DREMLDHARDVLGTARVLDVEEDHAPGGWPRARGLRRRHARREPTLVFGDGRERLGLGSLGNRLSGWCGGRGGSFGAASAAPWATRTCHAPDDKRAARAV